MAKRISITTGFITNSSSVVYFFKKEALEHPKVKTFMEKFDVQDGFVGDIWYRSRCASIAVTRAQIEEVRDQLNDPDWSAHCPSVPEDEALLVYGDEYESLPSDLLDILREVENDTSTEYVTGGIDYN